MSNVSLREFLFEREQELMAKIAALHVELEEVRAVRVAIENSYTHLKKNKNFGTSATRRLTIKQMAVRALENRDGQGTAEEIRAWIEEDFGVRVGRTSLSPQLSRLRADAELIYTSSTKCWGLPANSQPETKPEVLERLDFPQVESDSVEDGNKRES
jgi:hypothetical protein